MKDLGNEEELGNTILQGASPPATAGVGEEDLVPHLVVLSAIHNVHSVVRIRRTAELQEYFSSALEPHALQSQLVLGEEGDEVRLSSSLGDVLSYEEARACGVAVGVGSGPTGLRVRSGVMVARGRRLVVIIRHPVVTEPVLSAPDLLVFPIRSGLVHVTFRVPVAGVCSRILPTAASLVVVVPLLAAYVTRILPAFRGNTAPVVLGSFVGKLWE